MSNNGFDPTRIKDFSYYAPRLLKIKTKPPDPRIVPLNFNPIQTKLDLLFERLLREEGLVRVNVLKARREGVSTYVEGRLFHKVHTTPNTHAFIVAHDKDGLNTIFDMSKLFYDCLPVDFRPMKRYSSKRELVFENPNDKARHIYPGLRSKIEVFSANKVTASRSGGYTSAHFSEVAFYDFPEELLTSVVPSIPEAPGTMIIRESTANGRGNFFHDEWLLSKEGGSNYHNVFFSWLDFPEYQMEFDSPKDRKNFISTLDDEEKVLVGKHKATPEQKLWRRYKLRDYHGDVNKFHQEYPADDVEAFVTSGTSYFNRNRLTDYLNRTSNPTFVGDITGFGLVGNDEGDLLIWDNPIKGEEYVLGVDVGGGGEDSNYSVIEVVKVPRGSPHIPQVAEYRARIDPVRLAEKCIHLARHYNDGMLSIEINNHGHTTLNEVKEQYWNLYRWQYFDRFGKYVTNKLGWDTNQSTLPILCDYTSACINADILVIRSAGLVDEMMSFIKRPTSYGGMGDYGSFDDRVFAFMIGVFTLAHTHQSASLLRELSSYDQPIITEEKPHKILTIHDRDEEFEQMLEHDYKSYYKGNDGWLNY